MKNTQKKECGCSDGGLVETGIGMMYESAETCQKHKAQKTKHTAGEWYSKGSSIMTKFKGKELQIALMSRTQFCGRLTEWEELLQKKLKDSEEADLRLLVSAPLMLKALEAVLNMGDDYKAKKLVRKAIKQAKGE